MVDPEARSVQDPSAGNPDTPDDVIIRTNPVAGMALAIASAPALAASALVAATATLLTMSVASEIGQAKLYNSRGFNSLEELRWESGVRLLVAGVALGLAVIAGVRFSRGLPATRYTFSDDGEEATESTEGSNPSTWMLLLVGSSLLVAILAVVLNAVAFVTTLHLHESPNFGLPSG